MIEYADLVMHPNVAANPKRRAIAMVLKLTKRPTHAKSLPNHVMPMPSTSTPTTSWLQTWEQVD